MVEILRPVGVSNLTSLPQRTRVNQANVTNEHHIEMAELDENNGLCTTSKSL